MMNQIAYNSSVTPITDTRYLLMKPKNSPMFLYTLEHTTYHAAKLRKILHVECMEETITNNLPDYRIHIALEVTQPRATCDHCKKQLDAHAAKLELTLRDKKLTEGKSRMAIRRRRLEKMEEAKQIALAQKSLSDARKKSKETPLSDTPKIVPEIDSK